MNQVIYVSLQPQICKIGVSIGFGMQPLYRQAVSGFLEACMQNCLIAWVDTSD